jgi:hypothetical protein
MNSTATLIVASVGLVSLMGLAWLAEEHGGRIARWLPPALRAEHLTIMGYEHPQLVEVVFQKTLAYEPSRDWPEIAGANTVLDFGGGCGVHYKDANSKSVRWAVVETPAMVARAKELETDRLRFFTDIREAARWLGSIDVMYSNGALQYSESPELTLARLCELRAKQMIWERLALSSGDETQREAQTSSLGDNGPGKRRHGPAIVEYVSAAMPATTFLDAHRGYRLIERDMNSFLFVREG